MAGESSDSPASVSAAIDELVIAEKVLGVRRGHRKGVRRIVKGKKKVLDTSYSIAASGSEQSQAAEDQHRLVERVDAQQRDLEAQHRKINALKAFITQALGQRPPSPSPLSPPPPPPPSDNAKDLARD